LDASRNNQLNESKENHHFSDFGGAAFHIFITLSSFITVIGIAYILIAGLDDIEMWLNNGLEIWHLVVLPPALIIIFSTSFVPLLICIGGVVLLDSWGADGAIILYFFLMLATSISRLLVTIQFLKGVTLDFQSGVISFGGHRIKPRASDWFSLDYYLQVYRQQYFKIDEIESLSYQKARLRTGFAGMGLWYVAVIFGMLGGKSSERAEYDADDSGLGLEIVTTNRVYVIYFRELHEIQRLRSLLVNRLEMGSPVVIR